MEDERIVALFFERSELAIRALDDKYGALCRAVALEELDECIADKKTVEDTVEAAELGGIIERFLDTLSAKERVIFMRRYAFADSYAEIATILSAGISAMSSTPMVNLPAREHSSLSFCAVRSTE